MLNNLANDNGNEHEFGMDDWDGDANVPEKKSVSENQTKQSDQIANPESEAPI